MRVFVAGASGAIGTRLVPQLIDRGHEVIGTFHSPGNTERVRALGAEPYALDLLDARAVGRAVLDTRPAPTVHQVTPLATVPSRRPPAAPAAGARRAPEAARAGVSNIVDGEPAPMREWLPALAEALGARPPRRVPLWLAGLVAGKGAVMMAVGSRGASNAKAKRELG